ncbi:hypothetical protein GCM10009646_05240 [Streptomyces aureus]
MIRLCGLNGLLESHVLSDQAVLGCMCGLGRGCWRIGGAAGFPTRRAELGNGWQLVCYEDKPEYFPARAVRVADEAHN